MMGRRRSNSVALVVSATVEDDRMYDFEYICESIRLRIECSLLSIMANMGRML